MRAPVHQGAKAAMEVLRAIDAAGLSASGLTVREPSLDDVFLTLTEVANGEAAQAVAFPLMFPLTFASSVFVRVDRMPGWLQGFAAHQPVTVVVNAARGLMLGPEASAQLRAAGAFTTSTTSYVLQGLAWIAVILAIFVPLAIRQFNRS